MRNCIFVAEREKMNKYTLSLISGILAITPLQARAGEVAGPTIYESQPMKTRGTITTIGAYYEFEGEVTLEVSANAGSTYTKIINGGLLKDGFIAGNELRYKANIPEGSVLHKVVIGYEDTSGASTLYKNPDLKNYKNKKKLYISGAEKELFNYQVKIEGLAAKVAVPNQVYFTAADGQTPLYYCAEGDFYYVKVPQIPKEGITIYAYEGLPPSEAEGTAPKFFDANKVFLFYDDFNGNHLDQEKWQVRKGLKEDYEMKDGYLRLRDTAVISRNFKLKDAILEFKAKTEKNASIQAIVRGEDTNLSLFSLEQLVYSSGYPGAEHTIAINDVAKLNIGKPIKPDTEYIYKVIANPQGIIFERYSSEYEKQARIQFMDVGGLEEGYIGLKAGSSPYESSSAYFDWIRVRPYSEIEPAVRGE
jgi:hypothetical protein